MVNIMTYNSDILNADFSEGSAGDRCAGCGSCCKRGAKHYRFIYPHEYLKILSKYPTLGAKIIPYSTGEESSVGVLKGIVLRYDNPLEPVGESDWEVNA